MESVCKKKTRFEICRWTHLFHRLGHYATSTDSPSKYWSLFVLLSSPNPGASERQTSPSGGHLWGSELAFNKAHVHCGAECGNAVRAESQFSVISIPALRPPPDSTRLLSQGTWHTFSPLILHFVLQYFVHIPSLSLSLVPAL